MPTQDAPFSGRIPPCWQILRPGDIHAGAGIPLVLTERPGFGTGSHATTRLCLQAIAALAPRDRAWRMLDFGSGSGILAIAAAKLGAQVAAVEIDEPSIESLLANAALNEVRDRLTIARALALEVPAFDLVVANILRPVLLAFAPELASRVAPGGALVLSGLVATDVPELSVRYAPLFDDRRPERYRQGEWEALVWRREASPVLSGQ
ncbi:MAG TPA: 50S ribosomal protein L11 methyltransferase [Oscillatoriaceae cyanobacterium]